MIQRTKALTIVSRIERGSVVSFVYVRQYDPRLSDVINRRMELVLPQNKVISEVKKGDVLICDQDNPGCYRVDDIATAKLKTRHDRLYPYGIIKM